MYRLILITGEPGVGKSTVLLKTVEQLRHQGLTVGGMITEEVRDGNSRIGFKVVDLLTRREGWLAQTNANFGIRFGRYWINISDLERVGVASILNVLTNDAVQVVAIDEVGPMELRSRQFREAIALCLKTNKRIIATIHYSSQDPLLRQLRTSLETLLILVTSDNRSRLPERLSQLVKTGTPEKREAVLKSKTY